MKFIYFLLLLLIFQGCATSFAPQQNRVEYKKVQIVKKQIFLKQNKVISEEPKIIPSGVIKGKVLNVEFDAQKRVWVLDVRGLDMTNKKLPYAHFSSKRRIANKGDFIYAIIKNEKLVEYFLIKKGLVKTKKAFKQDIKKVKPKKHKLIKPINKHEKKPNIGVPEVESIIL